MFVLPQLKQYLQLCFAFVYITYRITININSFTVKLLNYSSLTKELWCNTKIQPLTNLLLSCCIFLHFQEQAVSPEDE